MASDDLLAKVTDKRMREGVTQADLAAACGMNQGHLSKVLAGKLKLATKTEAALSLWLIETTEGRRDNNKEIRDIIGRLTRAPSGRRMEIMQLLRIVDKLSLAK